MKTTTFLLAFFVSTALLFAQHSHEGYEMLIRKADSLYRAKDFKSSAYAFSDAFSMPDAKITINHRYNAACSYALANNADSAFAHLNHIAACMNYSRYAHVKTDPDLKSLYTDSRWKPLIELVKINREKEYAQLDFITLNGFKVDVYVSGMKNNQANKPVVVFENGMADTYDRWKTIMDEVSLTNVVFAYNRPRIGESEDDTLPPTTEHIVSNLRKMLLEKGLKPPYLLVSHSFGGAYIRSYASQYPDEIAGLIFIDPVDFTKKAGMGELPYLEMGFTKHQIDSVFGKPNKDFHEKLYAEMPKYYVEEVKISVQLTQSEFNECDHNPLPDVPVHFLMAGGYTAYGNDNSPLVCDWEKLFRVSENLKMKRYLQLLYPLKYGRLFYSSKSSHYMQTDEPDLVLSSIKLALNDYDKIKSELNSNP